jgi:hypothetical protein
MALQNLLLSQTEGSRNDGRCTVRLVVPVLKMDKNLWWIKAQDRDLWSKIKEAISHTEIMSQKKKGVSGEEFVTYIDYTKCKLCHLNGRAQW